MARTPADIAFELGQRLRVSRLGEGLTQVEVAERAGTSRSTVSRLELGRGGSVPLDTWAAVGEAAGAGLFGTPIDRTAVCVAALARLAADGGWDLVGAELGTAWFDRPAHRYRIRTTSLRPAERVVVRIVTVLTDPAAEHLRLTRSVEDHGSMVDHGRAVAGVLVVLRSSSNLRISGRASRRSSYRWLMAIRDREALMPSWPGLVWMTWQGTHLLPVA